MSVVCEHIHTDTPTHTHTQIWHQSMELNEVWKTGQRGLPVFINSLNAIQMFHASPVPTKSAHVSSKWQNIASLKWYTLTVARTSVRTTSAAALWLWSGVKMSAPLPVFIVHFTLCLSTIPVKMSKISLFLLLSVPGIICSFYRPHLTWQGYTEGYTLGH